CATAALDQMGYTRSLYRSETYSSTSCDDYLGLAKGRAYGGGEHPQESVDSARAALWLALDVILRLFAPVLPFATEEVWSWWREGSVHRATWPTSELVRSAAGDADPDLVTVAGTALAALRKVKSEAKVTQRTEFAAAELVLPEAEHVHVHSVLGDLKSAGRVAGELTVRAAS